MEQRKYTPPDGAPRAQEDGEKNYRGPKMVYMSRGPKVKKALGSPRYQPEICCKEWYRSSNL
jgi:hypothetical protein